MAKFLWDIRGLREVLGVDEHSLVQCVTVDTSRLVSQLDKELQNEESGVDLAVKQLQLLIENVYNKIRRDSGVPSDRSLVINLNFTNLKFSVAYWDILLERSLDLMANEAPKTNARYFITEATPMERDRYAETNLNFQTFKVNQRRVRNTVDMDEFIDFETLIKQIIFDLLKRNDIPEQDFEAILSRFHNLESLMLAFSE
ncbi:Spo16p SKDI_08G2000 [Saccharomyces kudriavzevii IFO 1802]|uniref:SPO16-like protein n=2 Tax=Saccharomyces kudriavzevii (strain ATCC MYA-4449 / AS 2.2408 / CBS 8840 / NBRC 1802 / NCYC 2889) TaxID=226230 RepID=J4TVX0_SACK1|nr:uncharacterized protein SKDI_08G2000 [Saccharomyces kudriavzevii IFO 1802]EJT42375.1 SPO16-like protein [Saccharomyces kudriavzevii IFO 1802]CAI4064013.1 hypothetical protein SKDI_08G2000 [Saccharomyces kudriavzevii IFO 1802]